MYLKNMLIIWNLPKEQFKFVKKHKTVTVAVQNRGLRSEVYNT